MYLEFLFCLLLLFPAFAEPIPDYDDPYSPIFTDKPVYTWTDKIKMKIIAPSWNADRNSIDSIGDESDHAIKIYTRENSLDSYRFTETDVNSGVFTAEVILTGFSHDADGDGDTDTLPRTAGSGPTSGFLETDRDSAVTISFEFADGVVVSESVPIVWNLGTIQFSKDIFFSDDSVTVNVIDLDMNLNPEALDQIPIQVFSDSDIAGITVSAVETSESSGSFIGNVSLSQMSSSGNRLYAQFGDKIFAKYDDNTLPTPYSTSDNLEIKTFARFDSSISPIDRLVTSPIFLSDSFGNQLESVSSNNSVQIVGTITNNHDFRQEFVYIFQVKNANDTVESLSWIQGEMTSQQILDLSQSWTPKEPGMYEIQTFVWDSLGDTTVLSPSMSTSIMVQ